MRVLHVTEAMGGGITTAVLAMADATGDVEHHLLAHQRGQHDVGIDLAAHFASVAAMPGDPARAVAAVRSAVRRLRPDLVHAHSSIAGVVARVAGTDVPVVYSPHCFAFERRDVSALRRRLFRSVERGLAPRTDLFLAVAPHELDLAADLGHQRLAFVPNRADVDHPSSARRSGGPLRIAGVGRVSEQKDWRYFARLRRYVRTHVDASTTWTWIGGGEPEHEDQLRDAGIEVTGWIPRSDLIEELAGQDVYVHTAAWEAAPISILEAASLGLPMAVRSIPALDSLHVPGRRRGVQAMADRITDLLDPGLWRHAQSRSLEFAAHHDASRQREHLWAAYVTALGGDPSRSAHLSRGHAPQIARAS